MSTLLKNVRLIKALTEGYDECMADILIDGSLIADIRKAGSSYDCSDTVDFNGRTLLPGFFDLHMHLNFFTADFDRYAIESASESKTLIHSIEYAGAFLKQGFTTVRDCGNIYYSGMTVKNAINNGIIDGPRIITAGRCITPTTIGNCTFPGLYAEANSPEELLKACREDCAQKVDFLKYMGTGSVANEGGEPGALITTQKELEAMQYAAESLGKDVAVHCHGKSGIMLCINVGIKTVEHASYLDDECIENILAHNNNTAIIPTLSPIALMEEGVLDESISKKIDSIDDSEPLHPMVKAMRAGVKIGWGTDISMSFFKDHPGCEFLLRAQRGFSNIEILKQVTLNSAEIMGMDDKLGTIKIGKIADFVIVDGNPDEDISVMKNMPYAVYKEGRRFTE